MGLVRKTVGLAGPLQEALAPLGERIQAAFVYGSVAGGKDRAEGDIDLMVIAEDLDYLDLAYNAQGPHGEWRWRGRPPALSSFLREEFSAAHVSARTLQDFPAIQSCPHR